MLGELRRIPIGTGKKSRSVDREPRPGANTVQNLGGSKIDAAEIDQILDLEHSWQASLYMYSILCGWSYKIRFNAIQIGHMDQNL